MPSAYAVAAAPSAFATLKSPMSGRWTAADAAFVVSCQRCRANRIVLLRAHIGAGVRHAERHAARREQEAFHAAVVRIHDRDAVGASMRNQRCLRREIRLHRAVVVEMVAREIREYGGGELHALGRR